ncbi:hypothetical protein DICVIV_04155 [Dictyocaulus viviparus]|uniref:Sodium:neurotransmitter symporter family protein n=1 Tax=Dictyocaulus viviparus TaxID=29172 RepID=A0A0D8Y127_DICVI|nr:hypothetical protein DICVIV_04155 [Dictyocaulus viviparus]
MELMKGLMSAQSGDAKEYANYNLDVMETQRGSRETEVSTALPDHKLADAIGSEVQDEVMKGVQDDEKSQESDSSRRQLDDGKDPHYKTIMDILSIMCLLPLMNDYWKFPLEVAKNGGYAFVLLYVIIFVIFVYPTLNFILFISQWTQIGLVNVFELYGPAYEGFNCSSIFLDSHCMAAKSQHDFYSRGFCWHQPPSQFTETSASSYINNRLNPYRYLTRKADGQIVNTEPWISAVRLAFSSSGLGEVAIFCMSSSRYVNGRHFTTATFVILGKLLVCFLGLSSFFSNLAILYTLDKRHKTSYLPENKGIEDYRKDFRESLSKYTSSVYYISESVYITIILIVVIVLIGLQIYDLIMLSSTEIETISKLLQHHNSWELLQEIMAILLAIVPMILPIAFCMTASLRRNKVISEALLLASLNMISMSNYWDSLSIYRYIDST